MYFQTLYSSRHLLPHYYAPILLTPFEPCSIAKALDDPHWFQAMMHEFTALLHNRTWLLVPPRPHMHVLDCKWVYQLKNKSNGVIEHYKACLVTQGDNQQASFNYFETFSPLIKIITVRVLLALAIVRN